MKDALSYLADDKIMTQIFIHARTHIHTCKNPMRTHTPKSVFEK